MIRLSFFALIMITLLFCFATFHLYDERGSPFWTFSLQIFKPVGQHYTLRRRRSQPVKCSAARRAGVDENGRRIGLVLRSWNLHPSRMSRQRRARIQNPTGI